MDDFDVLSKHPLFGPLHQAIWKYSFTMEDAGIIKPKKANFIRRQYLTYGFDLQSASFVDLISPTTPRKKLSSINKLIQKIYSEQFEYIRNEKIFNKISEKTWANFHRLTQTRLIERVMGPIDTENIQLVIYGHNPSHTQTGSPCIRIDKPSGKHVIAVAPSLYGLKTRLVQEFIPYSLPGYDQRYLLGWPILSAAIEIISREEYDENFWLRRLLKDVAKNQNIDLIQVSKDFVLGNLSPMLSMLDNTVTPVGTGAILFISHLDRRIASPVTINRTEAIRLIGKFESSFLF